jgi:hypothetical protein
MAVAVLNAAESMICEWSLCKKDECTCVYININGLNMLQQIPSSYLCSHNSSMPWIQVHHFWWFCIRVYFLLCWRHRAYELRN